MMLVNRRITTALLTTVVILLLLPNIAWVIFANGKSWEFGRPYAIITGLIPSILTLSLLFAILGRYLWISALVLLPFLPLVPVETAYIFHYGEPTWYAMIATALESNSREIVDFMGASLWPLAMASTLCLGLGVATTILLNRTRRSWRGRSRSLAVVGCVTTVVVFAAFHALADFARTRATASGVHLTSGVNEASLLGTSWIETSFPLGVLVRFQHWYREQQTLEDQIDVLRSFRFGARATREISQRQIYVLIIGEASRSDHWQLYGYNRPTTPELVTTPNLVQLSNIISPWSASRMAVPIIVSRKKSTDLQSYFNERSVTRAFSEAGFTTFWMSNQIAMGGYDSPISVVAYDADHVSFHNVADYSNPGKYDGVLIKPLQAAIDSGAQKLFVILHTLGSHENYALRYPDDFDKFRPSLKDVPNPDFDDPNLAERIQNSYDSSILYTDHFIAEVIKTLRNTGTISTVWYVSDHGEDLINSSCNLTGHGSGTVYNFRVPSVFWYSDAYAAEFRSKLDYFIERRAAPISTENIFESLVDMAALDFPGHDGNWSLFGASWRPHPRIVTPLYGQVQVDFDRAGESKNCHMVTPPP
jgi:glucan phosphoethanolaminetransferase (alkaline phosphatase superfamily)